MEMSFATKHQICEPVMILGVHRSGTSLLTRMLEILGLFVGNDLQDDHESNAIIAVNNFYFTTTGSSWDRPHYPGAAEIAQNCIRQLFDARFDQIAARFGPMNGLWGMKDPRFVVTLPLWRQIFPGMKIILIARQAEHIAHSLATRHQALVARGIFPPEGPFKKGAISFTQRCATYQGALSFVEEQQQALQSFRAAGLLQNCLELTYESLVADPHSSINQITGFLDIVPSDDRVRAAATLPRPSV